MNPLELHLQKLNPPLLGKLNETVRQIDLLLSKYDSNFPTYTDHSINHTKEVFRIASELLTQEEIENLNADEIYILSMSCYLHDIGMCIPIEKIKEIEGTQDFLHFKKSNPKISDEEFIRSIHHELSNKFILEEWNMLKIPDINYAKAIGLVAQGHRKVELDNIKVYEPKFFVRSGRDFVCLPYLASILRIADELDITNIRTPELLTKYYMPNNEFSKNEWNKHIATTQINFSEDYALFKVKCSNQSMFAALEDQFDKIQNVLNYCQKIIRTIANTEKRHFNLKLIRIEPKYEFINFDPKGIKFSFHVQNVIKAFVGEDLYHDELTSLREGVQNAIDSCLYKKSLNTNKYEPSVKIVVSNTTIRIEDNGLGMDEFIIENFFGKLASSYYEQDKVKEQFEAIGQFGVGVFSYFLLCDYIDIETKKKNCNTLKFRIDKDPKSYFHFFDKTDRLDVGTTVTLNLKDEFQNKFDFSTIQKYLEKTFRYIDLKIIIINDIESTEIICNKFSLDCEDEMKTRLKLHHKSKFKNYQLIKSYLNNDSFEGECGLIIEKKAKKINLKNIEDKFDYEYFKTASYYHNNSQVSISQKGVFVNNYNCSILKNVIGNINLKKKEKISIDRKSFSNDTPIFKIISEFEAEIAEKLFTELYSKYAPHEMVELSEDFLNNYFVCYEKDAINDKLINVIKKQLYFNIYINGEIEIMTIEQLLNLKNNFLIVSKEDKLEDLQREIKVPLLCIKSYYLTNLFNNLKLIFIEFSKLSPSIIIHNNSQFQKIIFDINNDFNGDKEMLRNQLRYYNFELSDSKFISLDIIGSKLTLDNYYRDPIFNINHPFIKYLIEHNDVIIKNEKFKKISTAALDFLREMHRRAQAYTSTEISQLNEILKPFNEISKIYTFKSKDFFKKNNN